MSARRESESKASRGRVLVVGDERSVLDAHARRLGQAGFEVTEATGGAEALQRMENHQFDLMLCDLSMPQVDALSLLKRLRARSPEVPVVLILDPRDSLTAIEAAPLGAFKCLVKPIAPKALEEAAANAVRLHRSGRRTLAVFHNRRGDPVEPTSFSASAAKSEFGRVLEMVIQGSIVVITKHDAPKAVLVSVDEFNALARTKERALDTLTGEFDELLARMQTPKARAGMKAAFDASPKQLGRAAARAVRKRD
jgi:antitoxin Phd